MANQKRKVSRSVPNSPVISVDTFLAKTPIPTLKKKRQSITPKFVKGVPTPIQKGNLTPNSEAFSLLSGFATGNVKMEGDEVQHLPTICQSLETIWETPKRKNTNGSVHRTKKAKTATKEPKRNLSKQIAQKKPRTRVPDSEIKLENIILGSPTFVPIRIKNKTPKQKGLGKGNKNIKFVDNSDVEMARTKRTETAEEKAKRLATERKKHNRNKRAAVRAK